MAIEKQMEMFDDGGLMDEGGTVDPVSGNEVPVGSTQEEVRDDIPAQLSEGEFVLPADVVRYHGLDKIMALRDEAKAGLQRMEDMGQMGNSEEATIPDGVPFDINDLDMDDTLEYNQGGFVMQPGFTGIQNLQPSQFQNYQGQFVPYQPAAPVQAGSQQFVLPQYQPPTPAPVPTLQQQQLPAFKDFISTPTGAYDELREYKNTETGETRQIPFVGGQPIYPIPEGFTYQDPDVVTTEEVTTTPTTGQTQVQTTTGGGDGGREDFDTTSASVAAAESLGYSKGQSTGLASGLIGGIAEAFGFSGAPGPAYGTPGTVDPGTGAVFGKADIPGLTADSDMVSQGFDPVTGQPMAVFSGVPSASHMGNSLAMAFGLADNPNATPTGYAIVSQMSPSPLAQQGYTATIDTVAQNTVNASSAQAANVGTSLGTTDVEGRFSVEPISPASLGFSKGSAGYGLASNNSGVFGVEEGDITSTAFGLAVMNNAGQPVTPRGTVVQMTDPTTGKKHSLLGSKKKNKAIVNMIQNNKNTYSKTGMTPAQSAQQAAISQGMAEDAPAAVSNTDDYGIGFAGEFGNSGGGGSSSGSSSSGSPGGPGSAPDGYGGGSMGGMAKGGDVTKQMKKSGLASKK